MSDVVQFPLERRIGTERLDPLPDHKADIIWLPVVYIARDGEEKAKEVRGAE